MPRIEVFKIQVQFGDCDPVGIAFYPNFFRWFDASSRNFFDKCGLPPWRNLERQNGIVGTPLVETTSRFIRPASYGDHIEVHTSIIKWDNKVFVQTHEILREGILLASAKEKRVFACRDAETGRMHAIPVPEDFRALCQ